MNTKIFFTTLITAALSLQTAFAATIYTRDGSWDNTTDTAPNGSDREALIAGNMWTYEVINAPAADAIYGGANEWWNKPADTAIFSWNGANNRFDGPSNTYPRIASNNLIAQDGAANFGWVPRVLWKAPEAGTVTVSGSFGMVDTQTGQADWVIGKRTVGGVYTALAHDTVTATAAVGTKFPVDGYAGLQNIAMEAGDQIFWTHRQTGIVSTGSGMAMWDGNGTNGRLTITFTADSSVSDWASE